MKKIILNIFFVALAIFIFTACDKDLELTPEDNAKLSEVFGSSQGARVAVTGLYSTLQDDDVLNGTVAANTEWQADNVEFVGSFPTFVQVFEYSTLANNTSLQEMWRDHFVSIGAANQVIVNVPNIVEPGFEDADKNLLIAEARFIRALVYFNMVNIFAQPFQVSSGASLGLPIVTEVFTGLNEDDFKLARESVQTVHQFIIADLDFAIANLPSVFNNLEFDNSRASKEAAQALKARLHLYRGEWQEAAELANTVINSGNFALAGDYSFYNTTSNEFILVLVNTPQDGQTSGEGFSGLFTPSPVGRGDAPFSQYLLDAFAEEPGDKRFNNLTVEGPAASGVNKTFTTKFPEGVSNSDNAPLIRITEMYLTRAEGNFLNSSAIGADPLDDINLLRQRAGLSDLGAVDLDIILNERRKELCFEGFRRMDLLRHERGLRPVGDPNFADAAFGADKTIFPVPTRERDINPQLEQNPGY